MNLTERQIEENINRLKSLRGSSRLLEDILSAQSSFTNEEQRLFPFFNRYLYRVRNRFMNPTFPKDYDQSVDELVNLLNQIDCWTQSDETKLYWKAGMLPHPIVAVPLDLHMEDTMKQISKETLGRGLNASDFYKEQIVCHVHNSRIEKVILPLVIGGGIGLPLLSYSLSNGFPIKQHPILSLIGIASVATGLLLGLPPCLLPSVPYDYKALKEKSRRADYFISRYKDKIN
jgi:hypothetical protein